MAKENVQKNRFKVAREILEASEQDLKARSNPQTEEAQVQEEVQGRTVAERYENLMMKDVQEQMEKQEKGRINLYVPIAVKEELDRMCDRKEIKNITHFINYLIVDYLRCRDKELDNDGTN